MDYQKNAIEYINSLGNQFFEGDKKRFIDLCVASELNPFLGDITYQPRKNRDGRLGRGSLVTSFEVYLSKASATDTFLGIEDFEIVNEIGDLIAVKVVAKRQIKSGSVAEMSFTAKLNEFKPKNASGFSPWVAMPYVMLRKCAVANAVRQLFADVVKLPYLSEELEQSDENYGTEVKTPVTNSETTKKAPVEKQESKKSTPTNEMDVREFVDMLDKNKFMEAIHDEKRLAGAYTVIRNYFITNMPTIPVAPKPSIEAATKLYNDLKKRINPVQEKEYDPFDESLDYVAVVNPITDESIIAKINEIEENFEQLGGTLPESFVKYLSNQYQEAYQTAHAKDISLIDLIEAVKNAIGE